MSSGDATPFIVSAVPGRAGPSRWPAMAAALCALAGLTALQAAAEPGIAIMAFEVPGGLRQNETAAFNVTVLNDGQGPVSGLTVTVLDGNMTLASGAPAGLNAGQSRQFPFNVTIAGPAGENHTFTALAGGASRSVSRFVDRPLLPASIVIDAVDVSPAERTGLPPGSTGVFHISVTLRNEGERSGTAVLRMAGMNGAFANDTFMLDGGRTQTRTFEWKVNGDRRHSAMATITGDVGSPSNMPVSAELHYSEPAPGFGGPALVGVFAAGAAVALSRARGTHGRRGEG